VMLASTIAQVHLAPIQGLGFMLIIISLLMANRKLLPHAKLKPESNEKPVVASNL
jgi:hypothetical protein